MALDRPRGEELADALDRLLPRVEKPTRYIGGEWNSVVKPREAVDVSVGLAFPDVYEIGMSHLGYRILYSLVNELEGVAAERAFMPWVDMLALLREHGLPLTTLETRRPLRELDMVGFSMQSELTITNVLAMLETGGIPLTGAERGEGDPLVLAGGPVILNPEPWADFFDLILIGDAEEALVEAIETYRRLARRGAPRGDVVRAIARIEGWYAPSLYDAVPEPRLGMLVPRPKDGEDVPRRVRRRVVYDLDRYPFPEKIVVPHAEIVHDRVSWEIMRGCPVGCRFCQAGYIYRPTRERDPQQVADGVRRSIESTGYDEFSLSSLNTGEYGAIEPLMTELMDELAPRLVSVNLSSMHASTITETLAEQVRRVRKAGFTIAPEAGSQRLRDVINKNLSEAQILDATRLAFSAGWHVIKLYFMIGLPTETLDDVDALVELAGRILRQGRGIGGRRVKITLSASTFVPKPFTPFQWFGMQAESDFVAKQERIRATVPRGVQFRHHDHSASWLEGVLSRADRRMGRAIIAAYREGAVLDGWQEHLDVGAWERAFEAEGIDADAWATRPLPLDAELPWDVVDALVHKRWLREEHERALHAGTLVPCGTDTCTGCAPFAASCVKGTVGEHKHVDLGPRLVAPLPGGAASATGCPGSAAPAAGPDELERRLERLDRRLRESGASGQPSPRYRYRARFEKGGRSRFLGHLDLVRALNQAFRRAGVQVAYSGGFKPRPKVSLSPALGLGITSRAEYIDFETHVPLDPETFLRDVNATMPDGLRLTAMVRLERAVASLQEAICRASYRATIPGLERRVLERGVERFLAAESVETTRLGKRGTKTIDLRPLVADLRVDDDGALRFTLRMGPGGSARPAELLHAVGGAPAESSARLERVEMLADVGGRLVSPLLAGRMARSA